MKRRGPSFLRIGRTIRYDVADLDRWLSQTAWVRADERQDRHPTKTYWKKQKSPEYRLQPRGFLVRTK
jgi:hypothetical protein